MQRGSDYGSMLRVTMAMDPQVPQSPRELLHQQGNYKLLQGVSSNYGISKLLYVCYSSPY